MPEHYSPLAGFVIASVSAIAMPRLMERLKLPAVLGYIAAGVLIGPAMLGVVHKDGAVITWLADIGKLLFMFFVGFEIDLALFNSTRSRRAVVFGTLTFAIPLTFGILLGRAFGYSWVASLLIGSIIASHTLLAYPVLQRLGVLGNEAVSVTISGTIFTDIAAMLVLAVAVSVHERGPDLMELRLHVGEDERRDVRGGIEGGAETPGRFAVAVSGCTGSRCSQRLPPSGPARSHS